MMIIAAPTDEEAFAKWELYKEGTDYEALKWISGQTAKDTNKDARATASRLAGDSKVDGGHLVNMNGGALIGSYDNIASMLDEIAEVEGVKGVMLIFDDFLWGVDIFGAEIQPRMKSRKHITPSNGSNGASGTSG